MAETIVATQTTKIRRTFAAAKAPFAMSEAVVTWFLSMRSGPLKKLTYILLYVASLRLIQSASVYAPTEYNY